MPAFAVKGENRRGKTAFFLIVCCWVGIAPHLLSGFRLFFPAIFLACVLGGYGLRTVLHDRRKLSLIAKTNFVNKLDLDSYPEVDILIAARDEELVISRLVQGLFALEYPLSKFSIWIIDDGSQDDTSSLLHNLQNQFSNLHVIRRARNAGGGKSGALNEAMKHLSGKWLLILDADAQLQTNSLSRLVLYAENGNWSAVQLRKSVVNSSHNLLTKCQAMEMAMDAVIQQGRLTGRGVVELRGNGQLLNRKFVEHCGGFNEATVTDDLDLSFRLLIGGGQTSILWDPPVQEEAVETFLALWKQRQRWAEGGLQRFFDYWKFLLSNRLSFPKKYDLACFFVLQYMLPIVSFIDILFTIFTRSLPAYLPLTIVAFSVSGFAYWRGCTISSEGPSLPPPNLLSLLFAILYLSHWFIVIPWVTIKMLVFPKKLIWSKTNHHGL